MKVFIAKPHDFWVVCQRDDGAALNWRGEPALLQSGDWYARFATASDASEFCRQLGLEIVSK